MFKNDQISRTVPLTDNLKPTIIQLEFFTSLLYSSGFSTVSQTLWMWQWVTKALSWSSPTTCLYIPTCHTEREFYFFYFKHSLSKKQDQSFCFHRAKFIIKDMAGRECTLNRELGFGSSFTFYILSNFTFRENVTYESIWSQFLRCDSLHVNSLLWRLYCSVRKTYWKWRTLSPTRSTWPGRFLSTSSWLQGRWSFRLQAWSSPTHR